MWVACGRRFSSAWPRSWKRNRIGYDYVPGGAPPPPFHLIFLPTNMTEKVFSLCFTKHKKVVLWRKKPWITGFQHVKNRSPNLIVIKYFERMCMLWYSEVMPLFIRKRVWKKRRGSRHNDRRWWWCSRAIGGIFIYHAFWLFILRVWCN